MAVMGACVGGVWDAHYTPIIHSILLPLEVALIAVKRSENLCERNIVDEP